MLRLKRVELQGFKSFCDKTELRFNGSGIAAVVGPNGCGKSNLSDAISWVLGEQSARSLRGTRMEDVIFAGTRSRKPLGMASVTMTLVNPRVDPTITPDTPVEVKILEEEVPANGHQNGHLNGHANGHSNGHQNGHAVNGELNGHELAHATVTIGVNRPGEVTITRRLYRSGESEYLIDGRLARLRDIQELFMGSGLGPESYAIIEQGRIGQILSSKPQDRRAIIEEAAGITKFKTRKRLAEGRLESARQNLARVFDILEEVTRQVNSLKRQASKARRYGELKTDLDARLRTVLASRHKILSGEIEKTAADLEAASAELKQASEAVELSDAERKKVQAACYDVEARLTEARKQLAELNVEAERTRGKLEAHVRESAAIEQRMAQGETEVQSLESRIAVCATERETLSGTVQEHEEGINVTRAELLEKNQIREQLQSRVREQERMIEQERMLVLRLLGETSNLKNQLAQMDEFLAGIARETGRVTREEQAAAAEIERLTGLRAQLSEKMAQRQMELETVTGERRATESNLATERKAAADLRNEADQIRRGCSHLQARKESIENVLLHHSYTGESVKKLLGALEQGRAGEFKPHGLLADFIEVDTAYERAAEEFLQDELEYVVVGAWEDAERGMQFLRSDLEGRATFLVESNAVAALPATGQAVGLPRLADHVRMTNGLSQGAANLLPKLLRCYIAESPQQARELSTEHPDLYFLLDDGQFYRGQTLGGGRKKASGPLALKRESRELGRKLAEREAELLTKVAALEKLTQEIVQMEADLERLRALQQAREKDALALDHELRKLAEESNRANSRVSVARLELERLNREQQRAVEQRDRNRAMVAQKEEERANREAALEALRQASEEIEAEAAQAAEAHSALRAQLAALEERYRAAKSALGRLEQQHRDMSGRRQEIGREIEQLGEHRNRLLAENIELDKKSAALAETVLSVESTVLMLSAEESEGRSALQAADAALTDLRASIEVLHGRRSEIEVDLVRRQSELKYLDETSQKELGCALADLMPSTADSGQPGDVPQASACAFLDGEALDEAERLYKEVKAKIEALGPINPEALAEYEDAQQRHDFLTTQRQDLLDSIRDTEQAIQEIDRVSKTRFNEAYEAINVYFRETFQTLFGGGMGEMRLTDENNAGESGIEIIASPPGKKLQNVLLLSGGEKALAALSLLMAIFRYQPSPFCVLDEVDAPLDEANILRLTKLLSQMSENTQFIMITHSKKTMESAQAMYGVTMQEAGVSKLVSVRFGGAQPERVAVA